MDQTFNLFLLEDDDDIYDDYKSFIDDFNKVSEIQIKPRRCKDKDLAQHAIKEDWYDGAIIDIRLSSSDETQNGNEIIREIKNNLRFPIRVYTGFDDVDDDLMEQTEFYKIYKRTEKRFDELLNELVDIYKTGITKILGKKGQIERYLTTIFWDHLSDSFEDWVREAQAEDNVEKILLRYTLAHLQEYLDKDDSGDYDVYHPAEVYIAKPINRNIHTGLILKNKENKDSFIVLTPTCDLVSQKAHKIVLAKIQDANAVNTLKKLKEALVRSTKELVQSNEPAQKGKIQKKIDNAKKELERFSRNGFTLKYHYLPEINGVGGVIDFHELVAYTTKEIEENFIKIASVTDKFRKDIIGRFSNLYSRQGQPVFIAGKICEQMLRA